MNSDIKTMVQVFLDHGTLKENISIIETGFKVTSLNKTIVSLSIKMDDEIYLVIYERLTPLPHHHGDTINLITSITPMT